MKKEQMPKCDPCERSFEEKVNELVKEGKTPTHMARTKREQEVKDAFGAHHSEEHKEHKQMEHSAPRHK